MIKEVMIEVILQGILEAFPVSSSIHLKLFDLKNIEKLHIGTGLAFFAYSISYLEKYIKKPLKITTLKFIFKICLLISPTICIGFYIKEQPQIDAYLVNLIFAIIMLYSNQFVSKRTLNSLTLKELIIISFLITTALLPGASRLGTTFTALRLFSVTKEESFINALIIGIPITIGAGLLSFHKSSIDITIICTSLLAGLITYHVLKITNKYLKYWNFYVIYRIFFSLIQLYWKI